MVEKKVKEEKKVDKTEEKQPLLERPLEKALTEKNVGEKIEKEVEEKIKVAKKEAEEAIKQTEEMFDEVKAPNTEDYIDPGMVIFLCPKCGKEKIKRSFHERVIATKYKCPNKDCGFEGPN